MKVLVWLVFEVDKEPVLQFTGKRKVMLLRTVSQECSIVYHKRTSVPVLESFRTDKRS